MATMAAAGFQNIDPETVQLQPAAAQLQMQGLSKGARMFVELAAQVIKQAVATRQVIERGIGGIALIGLFAAPGLTGLVLIGNLSAGLSIERRIERKLGAIDLSHEQGFKGCGHGLAIRRNRSCVQSPRS